MIKINYLTISVSGTSGGGIYDKRFLMILQTMYPNTKVVKDDDFFGRKFDGSFWKANRLYRNNLNKIFDCDYLVVNSRLYTRFLFLNTRIRKKFPNTKIIMIHHHSNYMTHKYFLYHIHKFYEKRFLQLANEVIIPNQYVIDQIKNAANLKKIIYLPTAFEKKIYATTSLNNKRILFVGNVEKRKGLELGLKAFLMLNKKCPEYSFSIVGKFENGCNYYKKLMQFIKKNHLENHVIFEGRVNEKQLNDLYTHSDLFLLPSLHEGYGMVLIEAMARGVPVLAFNNSAMPYTVKSGINGVLAKNRNWKDMGDKLCRLLTDKKQLLELQKGAITTYNTVNTVGELHKLTRAYIQSW